MGDRTADEHWRWGLFYFNPNDPALLVEKRMGLGYTLNFGNPRAWLMLIALVGVPLVVRTIAPHQRGGRPHFLRRTVHLKNNLS